MPRSSPKGTTVILWIVLIALVYAVGYFGARAWRDHKAEQAGVSARPAIQ